MTIAVDMGRKATKTTNQLHVFILLQFYTDYNWLIS